MVSPYARGLSLKRVAFTLFGGHGWTGGMNYLINLLSAISELPGKPIEPVLFTGYDADKEIVSRLTDYLSEPPVQSELWTKGTKAYKTRQLQSLVLQRDYLAEACFKQKNIDVVFQHATWYGYYFQFPTLAWIGDFQHRLLPEMFSIPIYWKREIGFQAIIRSATALMVMSEDAKIDCEKFYPYAKNKIVVLPFAVNFSRTSVNISSAAIKEKYNLPEKFIYLPNQFWKHKNHISVIYALKMLKHRGEEIIVVSSGNNKDLRNPEHYDKVISLIKEFELGKEFRILGFVPFTDIYALMRASTAVINPSLYEGWSTTVEEAKAVGVPLLLSNLNVHKEQAPLVCHFFNPNSFEAIAEVISSYWKNSQPGPHIELEQQSSIYYADLRKVFSEKFLNIINRVST
jgi:glycosyltransferase involved in cell wall biosynthesis